MSEEFVEWETFTKGLRWDQGEHVTIIGPTGAGKTNLARAVLPLREYAVFFASKPRDPAVQEFKREGMKIIPTWESRHDMMTKIILRPPFKRMDQAEQQREVFQDALNSIFTQGGWAVYLDEIRYVADDLNLHRVIKMLYLQGRSSHISMVAATQRPKFVPREMFSEATHFFLWRMTDRDDLKRLREISGAVSPAEIERRLLDLPAVGKQDVRYHDVLYVNSRSGSIVHTRAPR